MHCSDEKATRIHVNSHTLYYIAESIIKFNFKLEKYHWQVECKEKAQSQESYLTYV